jgi:hypothetical protein
MIQDGELTRDGHVFPQGGSFELLVPTQETNNWLKILAQVRQFAPKIKVANGRRPIRHSLRR